MAAQLLLSFWLSTHKSVKIEISGSSRAKRLWNVSVVWGSALQQEENALVPTGRRAPETRYAAFIKKDAS